MVGGYQIIDLTMIDLSGGDIPASDRGKELYNKISKALYAKKPPVFKFFDGVGKVLISNYEVIDDNGALTIVYGDKLNSSEATTILQSYNTAYGIQITPDGVITPINY